MDALLALSSPSPHPVALLPLPQAQSPSLEAVGRLHLQSSTPTHVHPCVIGTQTIPDESSSQPRNKITHTTNKVSCVALHTRTTSQKLSASLPPSLIPRQVSAGQRGRKPETQGQESGRTTSAPQRNLCTWLQEAADRPSQRSRQLALHSVLTSTVPVSYLRSVKAHDRGRQGP